MTPKVISGSNGRDQKIDYLGVNVHYTAAAGSGAQGGRVILEVPGTLEVKGILETQ